MNTVNDEKRKIGNINAVRGVIRYVKSGNFDGFAPSPFFFIVPSLVVELAGRSGAVHLDISDAKVQYTSDHDSVKLFIEAFEKHNFFTEFDCRWGTYTLDENEFALTVIGKNNLTSDSYKLTVKFEGAYECSTKV